MDHVFISYSQQDSDFAAVLMMHIEKAGFDTWMDKSRLRPGIDWSEEIDRGIREALAMVVVISPDAKASEYVTYEWSFAVGAEIPIIPVLHKQVNLHPRLARHQYLNFTNSSVRPWDQLLGEIREIDKRKAHVRMTSSTPAYVKHAINALDSANPSDRRNGVFTLAEAAERSSVAKDALIAGLSHPLFDVRVLSASKLVKVEPCIPDDSLFVSLSEGGVCKDEDIRKEVRGALKEAPSSASALLIKFLQSENPTLRSIAASRLGDCGEKKAINQLIPLLIDEYTRTAAIRALAKIGFAKNDPAGDKLISAMQNPDLLF